MLSAVEGGLIENFGHVDLEKAEAIGVEFDYSRSVIFVVGVCGKYIVSGKVMLRRRFRLLESNGLLTIDMGFRVESGAVIARV